MKREESARRFKVNLSELLLACQRLMKTAAIEKSLSARAYECILKVARSVAALARTDRIAASHISEAIQYRSLDRNNWA